MDMDEVGRMEMEWIILVQGAVLSQAFVDTGHSQSVCQSVKIFATCCKLLEIKVQTKKFPSKTSTECVWKVNFMKSSNRFQFSIFLGDALLC
jgi:hypothetical protein